MSSRSLEISSANAAIAQWYLRGNALSKLQEHRSASPLSTDAFKSVEGISALSVFKEKIFGVIVVIVHELFFSFFFKVVVVYGFDILFFLFFYFSGPSLSRLEV
eukprot:PhF_6_TR25156/c4_g1_i4/m.34668